MKKIHAIILASFFVCAFALPQYAEAKDITWTANSFVNALAEFGAQYGGGITYPSVTVQYHAVIIRTDTGAMVSDASSLPVGTPLLLKFIPHNFTDLYWFTTGYSSDSPYGEWSSSALLLPSSAWCGDTNDYAYTDSGGFGSVDLYIPFSVNPPTEHITTSGLTCSAPVTDSNGNLSKSCTVSGAGPISVSFSVDATYAKFYYFADYSNSSRGSGCDGSTYAMRTPAGTSDYVLTVPSQSIPSFTLTGYSPQCTSIPNACNQTNTGTCPQAAPPLPTGYGSACTSGANMCGQTSSGTIQCDSSCSASTPSNPAGYGNACTSAANSCGMTNAGTNQCDGSCSATKPADSSCPLPNITVTVAPTGPTTFTVGTSETWSGSIANAGNGAASNVPNVLQVLNSTGTTNLGYFVASPSTVNIPISSSQSVTGTVPSNTSPFTTAGTYKVRFCGNMNSSGTNIITESKYDDNCGPMVTVTVTPAYSCIPTLTASPTTFSPGQTVNLMWSEVAACDPANTCLFSDGYVGGLSGTYTVTPPTPSSGTTDTYSVTCPSTIPAQTNQAVITVSVPTATITAVPNRIRSGGATTVTWSSANTTACTVTKNGSAFSSGISGSSVDNPTTQALYVLTCTTNGNSITKNAMVNMVPSYSNF